MNPRVPTLCNSHWPTRCCTPWGPRSGSGRFPTQWFTEGTAVFYQRVLPLRAGLLSPQRFLEDLNKSATRYYINSRISAPNEEIGKRFWEDTRIRVLPYDRGSFYFAVVNAQIRKASAGKRSLDDLILDLVRRERRGQAFDGAAWAAMVEKEVGPPGKATYDAMLAGAVMLPIRTPSVPASSAPPRGSAASNSASTAGR